MAVAGPSPIEFDDWDKLRPPDFKVIFRLVMDYIYLYLKSPKSMVIFGDLPTW
jgi:hypothetical protein